MKLLTVDQKNLEMTSAFAQDVFISYYSSLIGPEQSNYMADLFLSVDAINRLIEEGAVFRLLLSDKDEPLGFTEYAKEKDRVFLSKLYVAQEHRHQGLGRILYEDCVSYARENGLERIYLTVNKHNTPSYEIYLHLGFKVIDAVVNDIGHGYVMDDYIMEKEL